MPIVQDLGEDPQPRSDEVGGVRVDAGESAFGQALQDPVHGAAAEADGVGQLPHTPTLVAVPVDQSIEDGDDPVVPGDRSHGLLAHSIVILSVDEARHQAGLGSP